MIPLTKWILVALLIIMNDRGGSACHHSSASARSLGDPDSIALANANEDLSNDGPTDEANALAARDLANGDAESEDVLEDLPATARIFWLG